MTNTTIRYAVDTDGILTLTLNRPEKLNAFTSQMCDELIEAYGRASLDDDVRAVVVTGEGRAFCAGMDLSAFGGGSGLNENPSPTLHDLQTRGEDPAFEGARDTGGRVALAMYDCRKPIVGAVNGAAIGVGSTMLLPMDFRFASTQARFGFVFSKLGITPEACSTWFLPRIVGLEQALEWCYRAEIFGADEALAKGLVRAIHPPETLLDEARAFARSLVRDRSAVSIALIRQMLQRNYAHADPLAAHWVESIAMLHTSQADGREGVRAFREKRAPNFQEKASQMPPFFPW